MKATSCRLLLPVSLFFRSRDSSAWHQLRLQPFFTGIEKCFSAGSAIAPDVNVLSALLLRSVPLFSELSDCLLTYFFLTGRVQRRSAFSPR